MAPDAGTIDVADDCAVSDEEIGLILSTTSANHCNFLAPNLSAGEHPVTVHAAAVCSAAYTNGPFTTSNEDQAPAKTMAERSIRERESALAPPRTMKPKPGHWWTWAA